LALIAFALLALPLPAHAQKTLEDARQTDCRFANSRVADARTTLSHARTQVERDWFKQQLQAAEHERDVACASNTTSSTSACSIITESDASQALGEEVRENAHQDTCSYSPALGTRNRDAGYLLLEKMPLQEFMAARNDRARLQPMSGIGNEAYYDGSISNSKRILVRKGNNVVEITHRSLPGLPNPDEVLLRLGRLAASRM
jgi:hypothetical protein